MRDAPPPFRPSPHDCGVREFTTRTATVLPQLRRTFDTLADIRESSSPRANKAALAFSLPGPAQLYRTCRTSEAAPALPANFALWLSKVDLRDLRRVFPGDTTEITDERSGDCGYDIKPGDRCTFRLELDLRVRRWDPNANEPYP